MKVNTFSAGTVTPNQVCSCICYTDGGNSTGATSGSNKGSCGATCKSGDNANGAANYNKAYSAMH